MTNQNLMRLLSLVLSICWCGPILASDIRIDESQILALFFERNLDLLAARYQIDSAEAQELVAAAIPNPTVSLGTNELSSGAGFAIRPSLGQVGLGINVFISQLLETNGKRELRMESSRLGREASVIDFRDAVRTLANAVRHSYYGLIMAQKGLELARDQVRHYDEIVQANKLRLAAGDIAESDLLRIEVESFKAKAEFDSAVTTLKSARSELAMLLSWPQQSMDFVAVENWPDIGTRYLERDEADLISKAYELRPDYQAIEIRTRQAEKDVELARRLVVPDLTVTGGYLQDAGNVKVDTGMVNISAPIPVFYQFQGEVGKAVVGLNDIRLQGEQARNSIRDEVVRAYANLQSASQIVRRFESEVNQRLEKVRMAAEFAYSQGASGLIELLDAERSYKTIMMDYYAALNQRSLAYADLVKATGEEPKP